MLLSTLQDPWMLMVREAEPLTLTETYPVQYQPKPKGEMMPDPILPPVEDPPFIKGIPGKVIMDPYPSTDDAIMYPRQEPVPLIGPGSFLGDPPKGYVESDPHVVGPPIMYPRQEVFPLIGPGAADPAFGPPNLIGPASFGAPAEPGKTILPTAAPEPLPEPEGIPGWMKIAGIAAVLYFLVKK
jgi:hypothetical protein